MKKQIDHLQNYKWTGLFFFESCPNWKFNGELTYEPLKGIKLKCLFLGKLPKEIKNTDIVLGFIFDFGEITLIPNWTHDFYGRDLPSSLTQQTLSFSYCIFGKHFKSTELSFSTITIKFTNSKLAILGHQNTYTISYLNKERVIYTEPEYEISLRHSGDHQLITNNFFQNIENLDDEESKKRINVKFKDLMASEKCGHFTRVSNLEYLAAFKLSTPCGLKKLRGTINDFLLFISLLSLKYQNWKSITLSEGYKSQKFQALFWKPITHKVYNTLKNEDPHRFSYPLSLSDLSNTEESLKTWKNFKQKEPNFLIDYFFSYLSFDASYYERYIFLLSTIEQVIYETTGTVTNYMKEFINHYCSDEAKEMIKRELDIKNDDDIPRNLKSIRNQLVHSVASSRLTPIALNFVKMNNILSALTSGLLVYFYRKHGFSLEKVSQFSKNYTNYLPTYYESNI